MNADPDPQHWFGPGFSRILVHLGQVIPDKTVPQQKEEKEVYFFLNSWADLYGVWRA